MSGIDARRDEFMRRLLGENPSPAPHEFSEGLQSEALTKIEGLLGAQPLKAYARELSILAMNARRYKLKAGECVPSVLISIAPGNGLTLSLRLMAELLDELGLFEFTGRRKIYELKVRNDYDETNPSANTISEIKRLVETEGFRGLISLNIADYVSNRIHESFFKSLLDQCNGYIRAELALFAFAAPALEQQALERIRGALSSRLSVRTITIPPVSQGILLDYAKGFFDERGIHWPEECDTYFLKALHAERSDGQFYGFATARKLCGQILYYMLALPACGQGAAENPAVSPQDIMWLLPAQDIARQDAMQTLGELVGLEGIKASISGIIASIQLQRALLSEGKPATPPVLHMIFSGPPGTGKTTVARIIGKIFKQEGILAHGNFIEVTRRDLVGRYVGHTAVLTTDICHSAHGSILFIDEAYALAPDRDHTDTFGLEAVSTLITEMENNRDTMCVIMAGYSADMDRLLETNPGLRDRFAYRLEFDGYTRGQLTEIFFLLAGKLYDYSQAFENAARLFFRGLPDDLLKSDEFSNARFVRNLFERVVSKAAIRQHAGSQATRRLEASDFSAAIADRDFHKLIKGKEKSRRVGFMAEDAIQ